jgi:hypothetical protein
MNPSMRSGRTASFSERVAKEGKLLVLKFGFGVKTSMRALWPIALLALSLTSVSAVDNAKRHGPPSLDETDDADKKAEYLNSIPYKPCPSPVRMQNGKIECLGSPNEPYSWRSDPYK